MASVLPAEICPAARLVNVRSIPSPEGEPMLTVLKGLIPEKA